jgi:hypothetical protein
MSSYDVQRRKLFPIILAAIEKAYNEYGLGLDNELAKCEAMHIFKDITANGFRRESEVAREIFEIFEDECLAYPIQENHPTILVDHRLYAELKKKYTEEKT